MSRGTHALIGVRLALLAGALLVGGLACAGLLARAAPPGARGDVSAARWSLVGRPQKATIRGGPWTLGQGPATEGDPLAGYPSPNRGTHDFQPYYFPLTFGSDRVIDGVFDYRVRNAEEAIVSAHSDDGGRSWVFASQALRFTPNRRVSADSGDDDGQGHPFAMEVAGRKRLYTLDRRPDVQGSGLLVHELRGASLTDLKGLPANETPPSTATQTTGLLAPDGIIDLVPGAQPTTVLYLQKVRGDTPLKDVATVRVATTLDGVSFTDLGPARGLSDSTTRFIGPRGTIVTYGDGTTTRYGLFYSGGIDDDDDSDAYRFIGYAESDDLFNWAVVNGLGNPLVSRDRTDPSGGPQRWYAGRVYGPQVTFSSDGQRGTLVFAGYHMPGTKDDPSNYRTIGAVTLERSGSPLPIVGRALTSGSTAPADNQPAASGGPCYFDFGFKTLRDLIPSVVGDCLEDEWHNPENGDALQRTTGGLLAWRKADNWTAFTDGTTTWISGPFGLQSRANQDRFPWESSARS